MALGEEATRHEVGERVTLEPGVPDMTCRECGAGRYNLCPNACFFATPPIDGAFSPTTWRSTRTSPTRCRRTSRTTPER
jgi:threonine dehydrogenase-like Zn-dependent dehydrogenase